VDHGSRVAHIIEYWSTGCDNGFAKPYSAPHRAQPISSGKRLLYLAFFKLRKQKKKKGEKKKKKKKEKGITIRKKKKKKKKKNI